MNTYKKVFISQPMRDRTPEQIISERNYAEDWAKRVLGAVDVIDSYFVDNANVLKNKAVYDLGRSILLLSQADIVMLLPGWEDARGCKIEAQIALSYGIPVIAIVKDVED